ncbi:hypothetical protein CPC08DRAFT_176364 [Agrocybe pediades]|nr:hypothetical protein CPC08DRAFT_176364 [Agrocybe pediades]
MGGLWGVVHRRLIAGPRRICSSSASLLASVCVRAEPSQFSFWGDGLDTEQPVWATLLRRGGRSSLVCWNQASPPRFPAPPAQLSS